MSRKDFELLARVIASLDRAYRARVALAFVQTLANTSPRFDGDRFLKACGVQS
jgi:hypothetical protein